MSRPFPFFMQEFGKTHGQKGADRGYHPRHDTGGLLPGWQAFFLQQDFSGPAA